MSDFTLWFAANAQQYDSNISINKIYLAATNHNYDLSIFISQIIFRANGQSKLGFSKFYKTDCELGQELGFSRSKIQRLKNKLLQHELGEFFNFETHKINNTPTTHWYVDFEKVCEYLYRVNNPKGHLQPPKDMDCSDANSGTDRNRTVPDCSETNNLTLYRSEPDTNSKIYSPSDEGQNKKVPVFTDCFNTLWKIWPNSKKRQRAEKALKSVFSKKKIKSPDSIREFVLTLKTDIEKRLHDTEGCFDHGFRETMFSTYLNGTGWDEPPMAPQTHQPVKKSGLDNFLDIRRKQESEKLVN